ncbi:hypothetical protein Moror_9875 [Moniliophthora roreri MCA 2997]|uniref:Uncharacterized protein n=1 Tax=Moniliophthora roreri (strain MCA 2997) TaxID=1381753 RepID=V2X1X5_MONRO|nr:hypothetical protein Moror_9875 [Moniliophthora roreri MCA 2997]
MRGTCRVLNSILEPLVFTRIVFDANSRQFTAQLRDLARRRTRAGNYARVLEIRTLSVRTPSQVGIDSDDEEDVVEAAINLLDVQDENDQSQQKLMFDAVSSLINLYGVEWYIEETDPPWSGIVIIDALCTIDSICDISLHMPAGYIGFSVPVRRLKTLHTILVRFIESEEFLHEVACAIKNSLLTLVSLEIGIGLQKEEDQRYSVDELFNELSETSGPLLLTRTALVGWKIEGRGSFSRHIRALKSLKLEDCQVSPEFWDFLRDEKIFLESLHVNEVTDSLLRYMVSYSGLKQLELILCSQYVRPREEEEGVARKFFADVLRLHVETLQSLSVITEVDSAWCIQFNNLDALSRCTKLASLSITIKSGPEIPSDEIVTQVLLNVEMHIPSLVTLVLERCGGYSDSGRRAGRRARGSYAKIQAALTRYRAPSSMRNLTVMVGGIAYKAVPQTDGYFRTVR